jgi:excisionase family DNA binding protein
MNFENPIALTIHQAAAQAQVHHNTIRKMLREHSIQGVRIGRVWRIPRSEVFRICGIKQPKAMT